MKIGIFGCGAYGMSLSSILWENKCDITMWTKFEEEKEQLEKTRKNERLLPNFELPKEIKITTDIEECIKEKDLLIIAIPAAHVDTLAIQMKPYIKDNHILIATKGIEQDTGLFINQILEKYLDTKNIAVISGPTFAIDLISKMPAGLAVASKNPETIKRAKNALQNKYIKLRETSDVIGVEICGSIKNVIALSSGMLAGLGANDSTTAMLLTEAIHDMKEIIEAFKGDKKTVLSFAGFGDLLLTCTSVKSRNYTFGKLIGQKKSSQELQEYLKNTTVEGYYTLESIYKLLKNKKVSIPIIDLIYDIAVEGEPSEKLLTFLVEKA
ncbi:MAG: NAD(P)-dependent glycerol-3-phosphate dehydrogenase [bacterium]|nr:NAD(P)-dependent glycerol-3-phosphate dehydrogenase [bacterium]